MTENLPEYQIREELEPAEPAGFTPEVCFKFSPKGIAELTKAITLARPKFEAIKKNAENPFYNDPKTKKARKYADLNEIISATADALAEQGIHLFQFPSVKDRLVSLTTLVSHTSGEWLTATIGNCPAEQKTEKGTRHDAQTIGIAITYLRRYTQQALLNLGAEDDDGNGVVQQPEKPRLQQNNPLPAFAQGIMKPAAVARPENELKGQTPPVTVQIDPADPRKDVDGCPVSDADLPKGDSLPSKEQLKSYGVQLRGFKQDSRALKAWVEKQAGNDWPLITDAQFKNVLGQLSKSFEAGGPEAVTKLISGEKNG